MRTDCGCVRGYLAHGCVRAVFAVFWAGGRMGEKTGETFLRGTQTTDGRGLVEFETVYPGRTAHIHFREYTEARSLVS